MPILRESSTLYSPYLENIAPLMNYDVSRDRIVMNYILEHIDCSIVRRTLEDARNLVASIGRVVIIGPDNNPSRYTSIIGDSKAVIIGANGASWLFYTKTGVMPHIIVTDLDGPLQLYQEAMEYGGILALHPHGDNQYRFTTLHSILDYNRIILTSQVEEYGCTVNVGGFTDGDRAVYLSHFLGAKEIHVCCFSKKPVDKHKQVSGPLKRSKLEIAWSLIEQLKNKGDVKIVFTS